MSRKSASVIGAALLAAIMASVLTSPASARGVTTTSVHNTRAPIGNITRQLAVPRVIYRHPGVLNPGTIRGLNPQPLPPRMGGFGRR